MKALLLTQGEEQKVGAAVQELPESELPEGEVLVQTEYSCINYKDALALGGAPGIVRHYPMVPGIDLAGRVLESTASRFAAGDLVLATGWGLGEKHWGGYAERARLPADWLIPVPAGRDCRWAMRLGTAGLTAMLCVMALEEAGVLAPEAPVAVSGAGGGVGGISIALLHALGCTVTAISGREELGEYLQQLGAAEVLAADRAAEPAGGLEKQHWAGAVDAVGGAVLSRLLAETRYGGAVAMCGMAASMKFQSSVMPFILRGIRLLGIDSVACPAPRREQAWRRLDALFPNPALERIAAEEIALEQVPETAAKLLAHQVRGRFLVAI